MPPIHWVIARQKNRPRPGASKSVRIVAPVAVMPDIASNRASMTPKPTHRYGIEQRTANSSQTPDTTDSASMRRRSSSAPRETASSACPMPPLTTPPSKKPGMSAHSP